MFTLVKDQELQVLHKKGLPCVCPFQTKLAIPVPKRTGIIGKAPEFEMAVQTYNCNSGCHFFFLMEENENGKQEVTTTCTGTRFEIEKEKKKISLV